MNFKPKWLQAFLRRPSRADLLARVKQLTEQRDTFEERVYDSQWHLDRARNELAAEQARFTESLVDERASTENRLAELRLAANEQIKRAQASSNSTRERLEDRIAELDGMPKAHTAALFDLACVRKDLELMSDIVTGLRSELEIARQYKPLYQSMLTDAKKPKAKK